MLLSFGVYFCLLIAVFSPSVAFAYIDPGTGSILIQGIIAAVAAIGVATKLYWHRLVGVFRRRPPPKGVNDANYNNREPYHPDSGKPKD